jgi:hypothetical protein
MKKIYPAYSWELPPTYKQSTAIARLSLALGVTETSPSNRLEARRLIYSLRNDLKLKDAKK